MNKEHVIVEAKSEYTKQLLSLLTDPVYEKNMAIYNRVEECTRNRRDILINVQRELRAIPLWNKAQIDYEVDKVTKKCEWLSDLIAAIFISNVKILTSVKIGKDKKKIQITMPKTDHFVHSVFINTAAALYDNPFVFMSDNRKAEIMCIVQKQIEETIRTLLPFQNILQSYLGETLNDPSESESEESDKDGEAEGEEEEEEEEGEGEQECEGEGQEEEGEEKVEGFAAFPESVAQQNQGGGFFDAPSEEVKNVSIGEESAPQSFQQQQQQQQQMPQLPQVPQQPKFFADAADE
jgi:hypothetical protein